MIPEPSVLDNPKTRATLLYILGIVPLATLRKIAENVTLIRKEINFGQIFIDIEKGSISWVGLTMKQRPPQDEE